MASYTGSAAEGAKARTLANERDAAQAAFVAKQAQIKQQNQVKLQSMEELFSARQGGAEDAFKAATVGLVSAEEFKAKRIAVEASEAAALALVAKQQEKERKRKGKERKEKLKALSFSMDEEEEAAAAAADGEERKQSASASAASAAASSSGAEAKPAEGDASASAASSDPLRAPSPPSKRTKLAPASAAAAASSSGKDPLADTSFLPDRAREAEENSLRQKLADEWKAQQERTKAEQVEIVYSYWDGSGHRNKVVVTKGMTIGQFLERARKDIVGEFHELRGLGGDGLIYVKEDLLIPHHYTFYDLIVTKARGKSGPLFHFDVHDDVRLTIDSKLEKDESHAGKIVTKGWYERNKANFPASRWEVFDPAVQREKYSIKGGEVRGAGAK